MDQRPGTPVDMWVMVSGLLPPFKRDDVDRIREDVQDELKRISNELLHLSKVVHHVGLYTDLTAITMLRYNAENAQFELGTMLPRMIAERFLPDV